MYSDHPPLGASSLNEHLVRHHEYLHGSPLEAVLEPRRVQAPAGYHSPKCVSTGLFLLLGNSRLKDRVGEALLPTEITAHGIAYQVIRHRMPIYFVREQFARAVMATDLPHDFTLEDLHWPMAGMVLAFPPGFMKEVVGKETCFVYTANCDAGEYRVSAFAGCPAVVLPKSKVGWFWYATGPRGLETFVTSFFRDERVNEVITRNAYTDFTGIKDAQGVEQDRVATDRVSALMLKLLVVLNTRPTLVEQGTCTRPEKRKHGRVKQHALWSPNLIGWWYCVAGAGDYNGSHASPRMHWRRGHVRNQPHGPGRTLRKLIWLEPVLVGVSEAKTADHKVDV